MAMQEMIGISLFMAGGTMSDVLGAFKEAFYRYNSAATHSGAPRECVRYATRSMLLAAEYARQHGAFNEANYALMKAHFQVQLCGMHTCLKLLDLCAAFHIMPSSNGQLCTIDGKCWALAPVTDIRFS